MKYLRQNKAITLIALVITIIVLLILAGVVIASLTGENGLFTRALHAKFASEVSAIKERVKMNYNLEYTGELNEFLGENNDYNDKLLVENGILVYISNNVSSEEEEWLEQLGISKASDYFTVEFDLGENQEKIIKTVKSGEKVDAPDVSNSFFRGWYYMKESGSEDNATYTETAFDAGNTTITSDYSIYAKYYNDAVMMKRNNSKSLWSATYRPYVTDIIFTSNSELIPSVYENATNIKADSNAADIMAYIIDTTEAEAKSYKVIIYSSNTIYANPDSMNLFQGFASLENIDFSNFNTSKVYIYSKMFYECEKLTTLNLNNFNAVNANKTYRMFYHCKGLTTLDLSHFSSSKINNMKGMFYGCIKLQSIIFSSDLKTNKVGTMEHLFYNCNALKSIDLSNFNTSNVSNMNSMFYGCSSLTELDISNFDTRKTTSMTSMFRKCSKLNVIYVGNNWTTENAAAGEMFTNCKVKSVTLKQ